LNQRPPGYESDELALLCVLQPRRALPGIFDFGEARAYVWPLLFTPAIEVRVFISPAIAAIILQAVFSAGEKTDSGCSIFDLYNKYFD